MSSPNKDWYSHLVAQSKTDAIYTLIHTHLVPDWEPNHDLDFVVVRRGQLPGLLQNIPAKHISKKLAKEDYCFPGKDYVLLHNYRLTEYLHQAQWAAIIEDLKDRSFIELRFDWTEAAEENWNYPPAYQSYVPPKKGRKNAEEQVHAPESDEEDALKKAYECLRDAINKEQALAYARRGKAFLDSRQVEMSGQSEEVLEKIERRMVGYNIVAMVAAWNDAIDLAAEADEHYLRYPVIWDCLDDYIRNYLELLLIRKHLDYLQFVFGDEAFRQRYLAHYEAYISLFVNPDYECKTMMEMLSIIRRVQNGHQYR